MVVDPRTHEMDQLNDSGEKILDGDNESSNDVDGLDDISDIDYDANAEKAVIKKLDVRVVGLVAFLYLLSFLDRSSTK
jgi:hypothetical protein